MPDEVWAPVVYGRTVRADSWWRAAPSGLPYRGWLGDLVAVVVAGGEHLDRPRFLLARWNEHWVTGVACMAAELDTELASDGRRPLYTFVGWAAPADSAARPPALDQMEAHFREWAAPVYQEWVGLDWNQHASKVREPHASAAQAVLWPDPEPSAAELPGLHPEPGTTEIRPASEGSALWQAGTATAEPFVLVVGWDATHNVPRADLTHATAADATSTTRGAQQPSGALVISPAPAQSSEPRPPDPIGRAHITIGAPARRSSPSRLRSLSNPTTWGWGGRPADDPGPRVEVRALIVSDDDQVLVMRRDNRWELPGAPMTSDETPTQACRRIVDETLQISVEEAAALLVTYAHGPTGGTLSVIFHCTLTHAPAIVHASPDVKIALAPINDARLPPDILKATDQLLTGSTNPLYTETS